MKLFLLTLGAIAAMLIGVLVLGTLIIIIDELELIDKWILWVEDMTDKCRDGLRSKRGG